MSCWGVYGSYSRQCWPDAKPRWRGWEVPQASLGQWDFPAGEAWGCRTPNIHAWRAVRDSEEWTESCPQCGDAWSAGRILPGFYPKAPGGLVLPPHVPDAQLCVWLGVGTCVTMCVTNGGDIVGISESPTGGAARALLPENRDRQREMAPSSLWEVWIK